MKKNPFVRACMSISVLMLGAVFVACVTEPEVETATTDQDVIEPATSPAFCDTGTLQCCNSVQQANSSAVTLLAGLLGIVIQPIGLVGLTCSPISVIGAGGNSCTAQTVCCTGNNFSGLIVLGCSPVNVNL